MENHILLKIVSENQFSGEDLFLYNCLQTFSKNLTLTYDLARRTVISRVSDRKMERVLNEVHQPFTPAQVRLLPYWIINTPPSTIDYRDFVSFSSVSRDLDAVKCGHWSFPGFKHCVVQICHSPICITSPIIYQSSEVGSSRVLF